MPHSYNLKFDSECGRASPLLNAHVIIPEAVWNHHGTTSADFVPLHSIHALEHAQWHGVRHADERLRVQMLQRFRICVSLSHQGQETA